MDLFSCEFPGDTGRLKMICWVIFLQANSIRLEVTLQGVPLNGKGEARPHQASNSSRLQRLMFRDHSGNC